MRYAVILNPVSGQGKSLNSLLKLQKWASKNRVKFDFFMTTGPGDGFKLGRFCRLERFGRVVVVGGDGTINEVGSALVGSNIPLGVIPGGNGNDFFKMLGVNGNRDSVFYTAFFGEPREVDVGIINQKPFFNSVGVGFDAEVAETVRKSERLSGIGAYLAAVLKAWRNLKPIEIEIDLDGMILEKKITLACIGNGKCSGGGFYLTPSARIDDGLFDICVIGDLPKSGIVKYLPKAMNGSHIRLEKVTIFRSRKIIINSKSAFPVHIDGEPMDPRPKRVELKLNADKILVAMGGKNDK